MITSYLRLSARARARGGINALIKNRCLSRQVLDTRALGKFLRGRAVSVASVYICDSVYAEAITHVQRMDV